MSSGRARANHSHYLAKILLSAWRAEADKQSLPQRVLSQAFLPAIRLHLLDAYGWFLLDISGITDLPPEPPHSATALPDPPDGKAVPGEIREFLQLEQEGWLRDLQQALVDPPTVVRATPGNLATAADFSQPPQAQDWVDALGSSFERMGDSLDEC